MMKWKIRVRYFGRYLTLNAEIIYSTPRIEHIKVSGRNRAIVLETNRPFYHSKGLKRRRLEWSLIEGSMSSQSLLEDIIKAIEDHFRAN